MIFVVVPAYNEEKQIGRVVRGLFEHGYGNVVVIDDGSTDNTVSEATLAGAKVLTHTLNRGQGAALQTGNEYALSAGAEVIVHFDADGQFNPADIAGGMEKITNGGYEVVLGSRFLDGRSQIPWFKKYFILPLARIVNQFLTGVKLTDAHNGFRILSRTAAEKIQITQDGMSHNSEIVSQICAYNLKYTEHPVEVVYHEFGQGIGGGIKNIKDFILGKFLN
ncbi:MAG: Glycosyl transferase, family 2 [Candidatus Magasanikbacteria bacterium GW2011_GWA2_37_8]|uniref:Glycosyl transferase, family 2 n=1 Tax=Candidatus Magasanikbacteria bacterium GW2011_GWA2_37_8 TaxID=1619036 RepID=A0A0G0KI72_9BACT|nr:MAG: Glycosyl transferase, family 2 [Candidatus Magasanikbacteria bacterium GW2011_GWA2_37_8]